MILLDAGLFWNCSPRGSPNESLKCISPHTNDVSFQNLRPLVSFKYLRILELSGDVVPELDNSGLQMLAKAWPQLQVLVLQQKAGQYHFPRADLIGLVLLLEHCPDLYQLTLSVNATIDTKAPPIPPVGCTGNTRITCIDFCNSPISRTTEVAAFLSVITPNLQYTSSWTGNVTPNSGSSAKEYRRRWESVAEMVPVFSQVRKQERETYMGTRAKM